MRPGLSWWYSVCNPISFFICWNVLLKKSTFQDKRPDKNLYIIIRKSTITKIQWLYYSSIDEVCLLTVSPLFCVDQCLPMFFLVMKNKVATSVLSIDCNKEKVSRGKQLIYKAKQDISNSNSIQNMLVIIQVIRGKARFTTFITRFRSWEMRAISPGWLSTKWRYPKLYPSWR